MERIRKRVLDLTGRGELTVEQMQYLIDRMADGPELSVQEAETLIDAFRAETTASRTPGLLDRIRRSAGEFAGKLRGISLDDVKRRLRDEYLSIERNDAYSPDEKVSRVIHVTAGVCAGVALQPIPFADLFVLTPIQGFMAAKIARVRDVPISEEGAWQRVKTVLVTIGLGFTAQQTAIGLYKLGMPGLGGLVTVPVVWSLTYGIGRVMDAYFSALSEGRTPTEEEILQAFRHGREEGREQREEEA